jgi:thiamine biosynthesis lipoprotein
MKKRIVTGFVLVLMSMLLLGACAPAEATTEYYALDTVCTQQVKGDRAAEATATVNQMLSRITRELSINEGSYYYEVNKNAPQPAELSSEAAQLVSEALRIADETNGAFDPTIGPVSTLWNISEEPRVPSAEEIAAALPLVNYRDVTVEANNVSLAKAGMMLDLGGIAKGYAADLAVQIYDEYGIDSAILNLGGNVYVYGEREGGSAFRIGLRDPLGAQNEYAAIISVQNTSVVTSGVYERFFESGGKTYHHLFDPETGYPTDNRLLAATVVCENSTKADALSTALFVMGIEKGLAFAEQTDGIEAVFFTDNQEIYVTSGLEANIEITNEAYTLKS